MFSALIIDADGKTPATLKSILAPFGFEFTITENGPEAVNVARQAAPDIIFLRAELPLTSGFSVCNRLRRHEDTRKIPLVMYSSNVSDDVFEQHRNLKTHADDYLRLPLDTERLLAAIRQVLTLPEPAKSTPPPHPVAEHSGAHSGAGHSGANKAARPKPPPPSPRLDVELAESSQPARQAEPVKQLDHDVTDKFRALQADESPPSPAALVATATAASTSSSPPPDSEASDASISASGFKAQREALQLKSQLNAKNRELLSLRDDLEVRERQLLDAKKQQRDLQAQITELETQSVQAQSEILSSRETAEAALRDKQTALKREEGVKTRLEVTTKKFKDLEQEHGNLRALSTQERDKAAAALADATQRISLQASLITDLETERDNFIAQLANANQQIAVLTGDLAIARKTIADLEKQIVDLRAASARALAEAHDDMLRAQEAARIERAAAIASLSQQHQAEIDEREQEYRLADAKLKSELSATRQAAANELAATQKAAANELAATQKAAQQEQMRMANLLAETEENARLQIQQLTQTLAATEDSARRQIEQLRTTLASTEETARNEIAALQATLASTRAQAEEAAREAARRISALEHEVDELGGHLDRTEATLTRRRSSDSRAQQALAVALKLLEDEDAA